MAISPLPADNTKRYFLVVQNGAFTHSIQVRVADTVGDSAAVSSLQFDMNLILADLSTNTSFVGLLVAEKGSNVRNPVAGWTTLTGTSAAPTGGQDLARAFSIRGRSTTGRKVKYLFWGLTVGEQPDFEWDPTLTGFATLINQMGVRASYYLAIDGSKPIFRTNMLEDYNDHWVKELRP